MRVLIIKLKNNGSKSYTQISRKIKQNRIILILAKEDSFAPSTKILSAININISRRRARRLVENNLTSRLTRKFPLFKKAGKL